MLHLKQKQVATFAICVILLLGICVAVFRPQGPKYIALTFDDGPCYEYTPQVLDVLDEKGVKATFFLVGQWLPGKDEIVHRLVEDGQQIGNHTFHHVKLSGLPGEEIRSEIADTNAALTKMTGLTNFMVRPPFGVRDGSALADIDAPVILWTLDPAAGEQVPADKMAKFVISRAKDGDIILLHDTTQYNLDAVAPIIDALQKKGFTFLTVEELFKQKDVIPENSIAYKRIVGNRQEKYDEYPMNLDSRD